MLSPPLFKIYMEEMFSKIGADLMNQFKKMIFCNKSMHIS